MQGHTACTGCKQALHLHTQQVTDPSTDLLTAPQGLYSPSKIDGGQVLQYEDGLTAANAQMLKEFNFSLIALKPASDAGMERWTCWVLGGRRVRAP